MPTTAVGTAKNAAFFVVPVDASSTHKCTSVTKNDENNVMIHELRCNEWNHVPKIDFGSLPLGQTKLCTLRLSNSSDKSAQISFDRMSKANAGFSIEFHSVTLDPQSSLDIQIAWTPTSSSSVETSSVVSTSISFQLHKKIRLQCMVFGKIKKQKHPSSQKPKPSRVPLTSLKKTSTSTNSSALMRRVLYDDQWMEKQQAGFTNWINYALNPKQILKEDHENNDTSSLRSLAKTQMEAKIRRNAFELYHCAEMDQVLYNIGREIDEGRLAIRKDREIHADLGLLSSFTTLLLTYHPLWLKLGLEVVLGELLPDNFTSEKLLKRVIVNHFVKDPTLVEKYAKRTKTPSGNLGDQYSYALRSLLLKRFLMLVYFLDMARIQNVIMPHLPCLFSTNSETRIQERSSHYVVMKFCKEFLSGEGNIVRHLSLLGYELTYRQSKLDEFDSTVTNLAVDLRDGVRLVLLIESLTRSSSLSSKLRMPAVSRLQKVHNVDVALSELPRHGLSLSSSSSSRHSISAKDIVDGHREKTLALCWRLISHFKLSELVNVVTLREEINAVVALMTRPAFELYTAQQLQESSTEESFKKMLLEWCRAISACYGLKINNFSASFADGRVLCYLINYYHPTVLLKSDIQSTTYSSSSEFSNNTKFTKAQYAIALAGERRNFALVNSKVSSLGCVPLLLPQDFDSTNLPEENIMVTFVSYLSSRLFESSLEIRATFKLQRWWRLCHSRRLFRQQNRAAIRIQRSWLSVNATRLALWRCRKLVRRHYVLRGFLASIVLSKRMRKKMTAVKVLQRFTRVVLASKFEKMLETKDVAALTLQCWIRQIFAMKEKSRLHMALVIAQHNARVVIKNRMVLYRRRIASTKRAACVRIQSQVRRYVVRKDFKRLVAAACVIQAQYRGFIVYKEYGHKVEAIVKIQRAFTQYLCIKKTNSAVIMIQAQVRRFLSQIQYKATLQNVITLQSWFRSIYDARVYKSKFQAIITLQRVVKGYCVRNTLAKSATLQHTSATAIQQCYKRYTFYMMAKAERLVMNHAVIKLQSFMRSRYCTRRYNIFVSGMHKLQTLVKLRQRESAALLIQTSFRTFMTETRFIVLKSTTIKLQRQWRNKKMQRVKALQCIERFIETFFLRKRFVRYFNTVSNARDVIASSVLTFVLRKKFIRHLRLKEKSLQIIKQAVLLYAVRNRSKIERRRVKTAAAVCIERAIVSFILRKRQVRNARFVIQQTLYRYIKRQAYERKVVKCQSVLRCYVARSNFKKLKASAVLIQSHVRARIAKQHYQRIKYAVKVIETTYFFRKRQRMMLMYAVNVISRWWSRHLSYKEKLGKAQRVIQNSILQYVKRKSVSTRGITIMQSVFRGYIVRKNSLASVVKVAKAIERVSSEAIPQHTLGSRLRNALRLLQETQGLGTMIHASLTLEACTRLSRECATVCVELDVPFTLWAAIQGCNRSLPYLTLLTQLLSTLLNLIRHQPKDVRRVIPPLRMPALMDILHMHRDQKSVFMLSARLLHVAMEEYFTCYGENQNDAPSVRLLCDQLKVRLEKLYALLLKRAQYSSTSVAPRDKSKISAHGAATKVQDLLKVLDRKGRS